MAVRTIEENSKRLKAAKLVSKLPNIFGNRDFLPEGIIGAKIVAMGTPWGSDVHRVVGGGLVIDYIPEGEVKVRRAVLWSHDTGMGIEAEFIKDE